MIVHKFPKDIKYIMDASAVVAVANQEPHFPELQTMFIDSIITTINLAEALTVIIRKYEIDPDTVWNELSNFVQNHYPINDELTYEVVKMTPYAKPYGLSLGDRYCLALAKHLRLPVYTADKIWKNLEEPLGIIVNLIS